MTPILITEERMQKVVGDMRAKIIEMLGNDEELLESIFPFMEIIKTAAQNAMYDNFEVLDSDRNVLGSY
jgi:hypothetical protein